MSFSTNAGNANAAQQLTVLRMQRNAGNTVVPVEVTYLYGGVQDGRHITIREELDLIDGEVTTKKLHGGAATHA